MMEDAYDLRYIERTRAVLIEEVNDMLAKLQCHHAAPLGAAMIQKTLDDFQTHYTTNYQRSISKLSLSERAGVICRQYLRLQLIHYYRALLKDASLNGVIFSVLRTFRNNLKEAPWGAIMLAQLPEGKLMQKIDGLRAYFPIRKFI